MADDNNNAYRAGRQGNDYRSRDRGFLEELTTKDTDIQARDEAHRTAYEHGAIDKAREDWEADQQWKNRPREHKPTPPGDPIEGAMVIFGCSVLALGMGLVWWAGAFIGIGVIYGVATSKDLPFPTLLIYSTSVAGVAAVFYFVRAMVEEFRCDSNLGTKLLNLAKVVLVIATLGALAYWIWH